MKKLLASTKLQTVALALGCLVMFLGIGYTLLGGLTLKYDSQVEEVSPEIKQIQKDRAEYYAKQEPRELTAEEKIKVELFDAEWTAVNAAQDMGLLGLFKKSE